MKGSNCIFCNTPETKVVLENEYFYSRRDDFPVTNLHTLIIPKRHVSDYFDLTRDEILFCNYLLSSIRKEILEIDNTVEGFNIGINCGLSAGQTVFHCHIHLIPRRVGDVDNPRGGVRHVISDKADY